MFEESIQVLSDERKTISFLLKCYLKFESNHTLQLNSNKKCIELIENWLKNPSKSNTKTCHKFLLNDQDHYGNIHLILEDILYVIVYDDISFIDNIDYSLNLLIPDYDFEDNIYREDMKKLFIEVFGKEDLVKCYMQYKLHDTKQILETEV